MILPLLAPAAAFAVFEVSDLSMKFERHLDCEAVDFMPLSDGYEKLAFLLADRTLAFHAGYGKHHAVRIPRFGRSLAYHRETCECVAGVIFFLV